ncbi:MAG: hypothetical protein COB23_03215 [Methylophaga sp.]|nr:MAG: hypothetical protein COB23_03215 [Methylophaga sp.]
MTDWDEALKTAEEGGFFMSESKRKLQASLQGSVAFDPAVSADISSISKESGVPFDVVERNKGRVEIDQKYNNIDIDKILEKSPTTGEFLSDPDNAKQAHDDIDSLVTVEQAIKTYKRGDLDDTEGLPGHEKLGTIKEAEQVSKRSVPTRLIDAFQRGRATDRAGVAGFEQLKNFNPDGQQELDNINAHILALAPEEGGSFIDEWIDPAAEIVGQMLASMADSTDTAASSSAVAMLGAFAAGQAGPQLAIPEEIVTIPAAGVMGFSYGAAVGMGIHAFKVESGHSYIEMLEITGKNGEKIGPEIARYGAISVGVINAALELTGLATVTAPVKATIKRYTNNAVKNALKNPSTRDAVLRFARNYATAWTGEVSTEILQEIVTMEAADLAKDLSKGDFEKMSQEDWDNRLADIFNKVGRGMALLALPGASVNLASDISQAKKGKTDQQKLIDLSKASQNSKLRENNSEAFKELVRKMGQNTDASTVFINPEGAATYFQGLPLEDAPESVTSLVQDIPKAIEEGRNLEVPVEIFATELAGTEFESGLMPHMKLDPDALTPAESQDKDIQAEIRALASMSEEKLTSEAEVYNDVLGQLIATGQSESTAKQYAILHEAFFRTMAERVGKNPLELYESYGLRVSREIDPKLKQRAKEIDTTDIMLDRLRTGDIPQNADIFGKTVTQFIAENGGILDEGGELASRDANAGKVGKNTLYRSTGRSIDDMAELLAEAGFIAERDENQVLDVIDRELRGESVFALGQEDTALQSVQQNLEQLADIIDQAGLDVNALNNEEIKQALGGEQVRSGEEVLSQSNIKGIRDVEIRLEKIGVEASISENTDLIRINKIVVAAEKRGVGIGAKALKIVTDYADSTKKTITLTPSKDFGATSIKRLTVFYKRAGFVENKGKNKAYSLSDGMYRPPAGSSNIFEQSKNTSKPVSTLTGNEIAVTGAGVVKDVQNYFKANLQGKVIKSQVGDIRITGKSWNKLRNGLKSNPVKGGLIPSIPSIIKRGQYIGRTALDKPRSDTVIAFHYFEGNVSLGGEVYNVRLSVGEDAHGKLVYNLVEGNKKGSQLTRVISQGSEPSDSTFTQESTRGAETSKPLGADGLNITILSQNDKSKPRGYFNKLSNEITLTPKADLSTFLHESSHFFLEVMRDLSNQDKSIKSDLDVINNWARETGAKTDRDIHERFASGFESYLMEGKAPSPELYSVFSRFKSWLSLVYKSLKNVFSRNDLEGVELSDEVRSVMDRLLASEEAIERANTELQFLAPFEMEVLGLTPDEAGRYQDLVNEAREEADVELTREVMTEMHRERKKWWREGVEEFKNEVRDQLADQPEYRARDYLSGASIPKGMLPAKLDSKYIKDIYGLQSMRKLGRMSKSGGSNPAQLAPLFGYRSGDELVNALLGTMNKSERESYVSVEADQRMRDRHGDMLIDGSVDEKARHVIHNEKQADRLIAELHWLNRATNTKPTSRQYFKAAAESVMTTMPINKVRPDIYRRQEITARNKAVKAATAKEYRAAALHQHQAVRQFYLYREALKTKEKADKHRARLKQISTVKYSARKVDPDYIQQIKVLVAAFDFRKNPTNTEALLGRVNKFIAAQKEANPDLIAGSLLESITSWKDMTLDDLQAVRDAAENLLTIGKANSAEATEQFYIDVNEIVDHVVTHTDKPKPRQSDRSAVAKGASRLAGFNAKHRKLESLLQEADGWIDNGPMQAHIFKPLWDAQTNEVQRLDIEHESLNELFEGFEYLFSGLAHNIQDAADIIARNSDTLRDTAIGVKNKTDIHVMPVGQEGLTLSLSRGDRVVLALNYGNEGNREALRHQEKRQMTDSEVIKAISTLSSEEIDLVNKIWEYVDKFYPELSKVEQKATGVAPQKVEADPFTVNGVQMRGGYYPLQADSALSWKAETHAVEERAQKLLQGGRGRASTKHGSTIERIGFGGQVINLSIDGLFKHVDGIVHDLTHRQAVIDADRILRNKDVRDAMSDAIGSEGYKAVSNALTRLASGDIHPSDFNEWEGILRFSRVAVSYGAMGYSFGTALLNVTGFLPAIPEVGKVRMFSSLMEEMKHPLDMGRDIKAKSVFMTNRAHTINRDVYAILRDMKGNKGWNRFKSNAFIFIQKVDAFISRAVWDAAYNKAIESGITEDKAVFEADRTVARTQSTGVKIDLSHYEDSSELMRTFTPMYSYFNAILNLSIRQKGKSKTGQISKAKLAENMLWIFLAPALLEEFLRGSNDDEEPEEFATRYGKSLGSYYLGQWVGVRELGGLVKYGTMFETPLQRTISAPVRLGYEAYDLTFDPDAEFDKGALRAITDTLPVLGFPSGIQVNRTASYLMELAESGNEPSPIEFAFEALVTGKEEDTDIERLIK